MESQYIKTKGSYIFILDLLWILNDVIHVIP